MTKPTAEFMQHNRFFGRHRHRWPPELIEAGGWLRCELRIMRGKYWRESGGPQYLERLRQRFDLLLIRWAMQSRAKRQ